MTQAKLMLLLTFLSAITLGVLYWAMNDYASWCREIGCIAVAAFYAPIVVMSALTLSGLLLTGANLTKRYPRVVRTLSVLWVMVVVPVLGYMSFFAVQYLYRS